MSTSRDIVKGAVYKAKEVYDDEMPEYDHYIANITGDNMWVVDCWPCDANLNVHPGVNRSPAAIPVEHLGRLVGTVGEWE